MSILGKAILTGGSGVLGWWIGRKTFKPQEVEVIKPVEVIKEVEVIREVEKKIQGQTLTQNYYVSDVNQFGDHCVFTNFKEITVTLNTKDVRYCGSNHSQSKTNLGSVGKYTKWGESESDMILCTGISSLTHNDANINKVSDEKYWDINNAADQSCQISMLYVLGSAFDNSCFIALNDCSITVNFPDGNNLDVSLKTGERVVFEIVTGEIHGNETKDSRYYA